MDDVIITARFTPMFLKVPEGYIGFVAEFPGASSLGSTLKEAQDNLKETLMFVLQTDWELAEETLQGQVVPTA
jgi:predicted RNase H-like HicB family nuclease